MDGALLVEPLARVGSSGPDNGSRLRTPRTPQAADFARPGSGAPPEKPQRSRLFELWHGPEGCSLPPSRDDSLADLRSRLTATSGASRPRRSRTGTRLERLTSRRWPRAGDGIVGNGRDPLQPQGSFYFSDTSQTWSSGSTSSRASRSVSGSMTERRSGRYGARDSSDNIDYLGTFKDVCLRKYTTLCRAWRLLLDPKGVGRVSFSAFCLAARSIGYGEVRKLWAALDVNQSGFITMDEWDTVGFKILAEFRKLCRYHYGSLEAAFSLGLDRSRSNRVTAAEFDKFCEEKDYTGDPQVLFRALDVHMRGYITSDNLDFLSRWQGERFFMAPKEHHSGFGVGCRLSEATKVPKAPLTSPGKRRGRPWQALALPALSAEQRPSKDSSPMRWA